LFHTTTHDTFKYDQNQLEVFFNFKGILYEEEAKINYRLKGFDQNWKTTTTSDNSIAYQYLPHGNYELEMNANYRNFSSKPYFYNFKIKKALWQNWWFSALAILVSVTMLVPFFKNRLRKLEKRGLEKLERQELKANLVETELKALRSQMNPHFIFNSLNSIQDLVLQEDTESSYDYIVLFSNLVRNALDYSNQNFIPLEKEIEFLETYLKLEKLRFDDSFNYQIKCTIKTEVNIPSLIIQPFIENAIVHGLFHKKGQKNLDISFEQNEEHVICEIIDNGIGRENARAIQDRQGKTHKSFALDSIKKRIDILAEQYGNYIGYKISDVNLNAKYTGTKVIIVLPCIF